MVLGDAKPDCRISITTAVIALCAAPSKFVEAAVEGGAGEDCPARRLAYRQCQPFKTSRSAPSNAEYAAGNAV